MAYKLFSTGEVLTAANVNSYLMRQTVMVFVDAAARTTALSGVLTAGMISYLTGTNSLEVYNGTAWTANGVGDVTTTGTQTLTNKTLTAPIISTISNTGTLTLPTSTDTLIGKATTDTLTNKTLTAPIISTISNTGTLTLPTSTDTLIGKATTDTLTNKTLTSPVITTPKVAIGYTAKTAAYTVASGDEGYLFSMNNAATAQFSIPTDATFNFAIGTEIHFVWITGAGQPTIGAVTPGTTTVISTGATSATPKLRVANSAATAIKLAANSWLVVGDLS
jgi:hypothetical protein